MSDSTLNLSLVDNVAEFERLEPDWKRLLQDSASTSVYLTWQYVSTWWQTYGAAYNLRIIVARDSGQKIVGIAPMIVGKGDSGPSRFLRCLSFIGTLGDTGSEFVDFIIAPELERELVPMFWNYFHDELEKEWDVLTLRQIPAESANLQRLLRHVSKRHGVTLRIDTTPSPYLELPQSWDQLLRSKSQNFRSSFKRHWNRLHKNHRVSELVAGEDLSLECAMEHLFALNRNRWGTNATTFNSSQFFDHHLKIAQSFSESGWLYFRLWSVDEKIAAARFDFIFHDKLWNILGGWDADFAKYSIGRIAIAKQLAWCIENGVWEYDFLGGESGYKRSWANQERQLVDLVFSNPSSFRAGALEQLRCVRDFLKPRRPSSKSTPFLPS